MPRGVHGSDLRSIQTLFSVGTVSGMTDGDLLEQFLCRQGQGAEAAFTALLGIHGPMVWDVCCGILSDSHAAEDAFQATFLVLARRAGSIRRRDAVGPWLHGVARRVAVRAKAVARHRQPWDWKATEMMASPNPDPTREEQLEALHEEVDRLAGKYRAPLMLCYFEGRTHAEAARLLKCPVGTVSFRLSRARELLRARLTRRGFALPAVWAAAMLRSETASGAMPSGLAEATIKTVMNLAAGNAMKAGMVPVSVSQLVQGEMHTMIFTKLTAIAAGLLTAGLVTTGVVLLVAGGQPAPLAKGAAAQARADGDDALARRKTGEKLLHLGLAMLNCAQDRGRFPTAAIQKDGKPLLSWRVALLPFLDEHALYDKFHLDEPWDSPHNKALLDEMPDVYAGVKSKNDESKQLTRYQVFVGPGALFGAEEAPRREDIKDEASFTIMVVEAAKPVPWTKPEDLPFDKEKPLPLLGGQFKDGFHAILADGSVRFFSMTIKPEVLRALITPNGGEAIKIDEL